MTSMPPKIPALKFTVLPQIWHERPQTRADCLTGESLRAALVEEWAAKNPWANPSDAPVATNIPDGMNCQRPCPFVGCRHHLLIDVNQRNGKISKAHEFDEDDAEQVAMTLALSEGLGLSTCSLDVADDGAHTLQDVGQRIGVSRQRAEAIEVVGQRRAHEARQRGNAKAAWRVVSRGRNGVR